MRGLRTKKGVAVRRAGLLRGHRERRLDAGGNLYHEPCHIRDLRLKHQGFGLTCIMSNIISGSACRNTFHQPGMGSNSRRFLMSPVWWSKIFLSVLTMWYLRTRVLWRWRVKTKCVRGGSKHGDAKHGGRYSMHIICG